MIKTLVFTLIIISNNNLILKKLTIIPIEEINTVEPVRSCLSTVCIHTFMEIIILFPYIIISIYYIEMIIYGINI